MEPVTAAVIGVAVAAWLAWTAWKKYPDWEEAAKDWKPSVVVARYDKWAAKHPDAWQTRIWWAASRTARLGKKVADAADRREKRDKKAAQKGAEGAKAEEPRKAEAPDRTAAAPEPTHPKPEPTPAPGGKPEALPRPTAPEPAPSQRPNGDQAKPLWRPDAPAVTAPRPAPTTPRQPSPAAPPIPDPPATPPLPTAAAGPFALDPIQEFMGDNMSAITPKGGGTLTPAGAMAGLARYIGEVTGLSQVLGAWKQLLGVAQSDAGLTESLTRNATKYLAESDALCGRLRATHQILVALEAACYRNELEPGALEVVHLAMEANEQALKKQIQAHQAIAVGVAAQQAANAAQQQAMLAVLNAFQYMNRVHVPKRDVELATGARSSRDFSTS